MDLQQEFIRLCQSLADREDVLDAEFVHQKHMIAFSMVFRVCRVELVYSRKWETAAPPSVLYSRFYLNKNNPIYLHLPELLAFSGCRDYRACYFSCIESAQRMQACFDALMSVVNDYIPLAERLGTTGQDEQILERWATEGFFEGEEEKEDTPDPSIDWEMMLIFRKFQESFLVARHTNLDAYAAFLEGDREKAIKRYEKLRKSGLSLYEKGLLEFLSSEESASFVPIQPACYGAPAYRKAERGDRTDLLGILILYAAFSILFCTILALVNWTLSRETLYFYGVEWWFGLVLAGLPAMFSYFLFQRQLRTMLGGDNAYLDAAKDHPGLYRFLAVFCALMLIGCVWFCIDVPGMSLRMYDSYAIYYTDEEQQIRFDYTEVSQVYHIAIRHNIYGDPVERASCVLILTDGRRIDLDGNGSAEEQLQMVTHLFPDIQVQYVDSDRDLPGA